MDARTLEEQAQLADTLRCQSDRMGPRERVVESAFGAAFLAVAGALLVLRPPVGFAVIPALLAVSVFLVAARVEFVTPLGFTTATQIAFVPLLFAVPVTLVPFVVAVGLASAVAPAVWRGERHPERLLLSVGNSWWALGPVAVFAAGGVTPAHAGVALLLAALFAQFGADIASWTIRCWLERSSGLRESLQGAYVYAVDGALAVVGLVIAEDVRHDPIVLLAPLPLLALLAVFARERRQRMEGLVELNTAYHGTALVLGDVVEADDGYTGEHCRSVVKLALEVGRELGFGAARLRDLEFGALLHDVGKIAIPKEIINKPGKLDAEEWAVMVTHTIEGQRMLDRVGGFMHDVGLIVRSHHERWDGRGYPDGLAGEAIPLAARIVACCDSWNAMRTDRSYRKALPHEAAVAELVTNAGHQFDPRIVEAFMRMVERDDPVINAALGREVAAVPEVTQPVALAAEQPTPAGFAGSV
jgi:putative nucleotidyltransferase with HDIG domain